MPSPLHSQPGFVTFHHLCLPLSLCTLSSQILLKGLNTETILPGRLQLAGQIARAAAIFTVDEIVVFDDGVEGSSNKPPKWSEDGSESCGLFLSRILKYMETPQYLRHALIPKHNGLQFAVSKILLLQCSVFLIKCNTQIHVHIVCQIAYAAGGSATFGCATSSSQA
jgi:predicted SPOUT superfamily RNA methylase MTH1